MTPRTPVLGVGVACWRDDEVLLIKRANPPRAGEWSLPGGRVEWGESVRDAALRELAEETGVEAAITGLIDVVDAILPNDRGHFVLVDFAASWIAGEAQAASDATDARWFSPSRACEAVDWEETRRIIRASRPPRGEGMGDRCGADDRRSSVRRIVGGNDPS